LHALSCGLLLLVHGSQLTANVGSMLPLAEELSVQHASELFTFNIDVGTLIGLSYFC
jgi:hypothetical protein